MTWRASITRPHLLATYYKLAGRDPPAGVRLPDASVAAPAVERAKVGRCRLTVSTHFETSYGFSA